jgi:hypothetical protein
LKNPKKLFNYQKYLDIKKDRTLVVCFDLPPVIDGFNLGLVSSDHPAAVKTIRDFYFAILELAKDFPELYFVVKPKSLEIIDSLIYKELEKIIEERENFEVIHNLKSINPYVMAYLADFIIGKHTSILEEAFSVGKPVIYYDSEKYLKSSGYILNEIDVIEESYIGLKKRIFDFVHDGRYLDSDSFESFNRKYFFNSEKEDGFVLIKKYLKQIYDESILDG